MNSATIAYVLSAEYLEELLAEKGYADSKNMVYSGGGHTILEFTDTVQAKEMVSEITETIYRKCNGLEVFAKICKYDEMLSPKINQISLQ